jgi:putative ABC transport system permease protein
MNSMIKVTGLHKYYHKGQNNEIHAVNDINYEFPATGLVCLLGPSGCGKTTLLNIVGGLDKPNRGTVAFKDTVIPHYQAKQWDLIRSRHFGYVFQNYYLLPDLTVYQNLEFMLKIFNLKREEIDRRIEYALTAVGMFKYRKRKPYQLSGGQQQRVAIARALVKSSDVVLADEPTGNLDEKNKMQIMNIIKKISAECLVILVTHERRLAEFYGDVIIELRDGKITEIRENAAKGGEFESRDDRNIYLPEFMRAEIGADSISVNYYYKERPAPLKLNLIYHNGAYYIQGEAAEKVEIKVVDDHSETKILATERPVIKQEDFYDFNYEMPKLEGGKPRRPAIKYRDTFRMALRELGRLRRGQRFFLVVLVFAAIMVVYAMITFFSSLRVKEEDFLEDNRNLVEIIGTKDFKVADFHELADELGVDFLLGPSRTIYMTNIDLNWFQQYNGRVNLPSHSILPLDIYDMEDKLVAGRLPEAPYEAVIDQYLVDIILDSRSFKQNGGRYPEQLLGQPYSTLWAIEGKIVGIVNTGNPNAYLNVTDYREMMINNVYYQSALVWAAENVKLTEYYDLSEWGEVDAVAISFDPAALAPDEVIVSENYYQELMVLEQAAVTTVTLDKEYRIVGYHKDRTQYEVIMRSENLEDVLYYRLEQAKGIKGYHPCVYSEDKDATILKLEELGLSGKDLYKVLRREYFAYNFSFSRYAFAIMILLASLLFIYFLMRASLIRRVYEVGVYRALGIRKTNIYRLFFAEIIVLTAITALIGVFIATYFVNELNNLTSFELVYFPWYIPPISLAFIFAINIITGMLPVMLLLRKPPAQILSKYDI